MTIYQNGIVNNMINSELKSQGKLPDYIIIGVQKAGTTALINNLGKHPDILIAKVEVENSKRLKKEINFFSHEDRWEKGITWYSNLFSEPDKIQGEKSPSYMKNAKAIERMAEVIPDVKLIIMLRNPVTRAYSAWNHFNQSIKKSQKRGWRIESFETAISLAEQKEKPFTSLLALGNYMHQINTLLQYFPQEQLFFGIAERFLEDPNGQINKVLDFLGAERMDLEPEIRHKREYSEGINPETKKHLEKLFEPYNQQLFDFLGEEIAEWKGSDQ